MFKSGCIDQAFQILEQLTIFRALCGLTNRSRWPSLGDASATTSLSTSTNHPHIKIIPRFVSFHDFMSTYKGRLLHVIHSLTIWSWLWIVSYLSDLEVRRRSPRDADGVLNAPFLWVLKYFPVFSQLNLDCHLCLLINWQKRLQLQCTFFSSNSHN